MLFMTLKVSKWGNTVRNPRQRTFLHPQDHCCGPILQMFPLKHQQDLVFPHKGRNATPGPSAGHLLPGLLHLTLGWTPSLLTKLLQRIQNAAARLIYNLPKSSHVTPLLLDLHWLPVAAHIQFKTMMMAFKAVNVTAPISFQTLVRPHAQHERSITSAGRLVPPSLRANKASSAQSPLFSVLAPQWWNELLTNVRTAESLSIYRKRLKTHLFWLHLDPA